MAQQLRGRGQRQSRHCRARGGSTNRIRSARSVSRIDASGINRDGNGSTTDSDQAVFQEPYREISLPISNIPAFPSQQKISGAQTVEVTYKIYQTPSQVLTQPQHSKSRRYNSGQAFPSNQTSFGLFRPQSELDLQTDHTSYPGRHGANISKAVGQDNVSSNVCRPKTGKPKKTSLSRFDDKEKSNRSNNGTVKDDPDEIAVFTYLVKNMKGIGTPDDIVDKSMLFTNCDDVTAWFKSHSSIFTIFEKLNKIIKIAVYWNDATYCWNYNSKRSCDDSECLRYHICRNLLSGYCRFGDRCKFSHDCLDQDNSSISSELGFTGKFRNEEIINILQVRFPRICESWNQNASCSDKCCTNLHMCPNYVLGRCEEGPNCRFERSKDSVHNNMVMKAYRMQNKTDDNFKKVVYVTRHPETAEEAVLAMQDESILERDLDTTPVFLCEKNVIKRCRDSSCTDLHVDRRLHRLPYIWQVKIDNEWIVLAEDQSMKIEEDYCAVKDISDPQKLAFDGDDYQYRVVFRPGIKALLMQDGNGGEESLTEARRLSTMSYSAGKFVEKSFKTQWRWYWENDLGRPQLFAPDNLQHTLENKFVNKQLKYLYQRQNDIFRYSIDFNSMTQLNLSTHKKRKIYRRPAVPVTADDIFGSWLLPVYASVWISEVDYICMK